MNKLQLNSNKI